MNIFDAMRIAKEEGVAKISYTPTPYKKKKIECAQQTAGVDDAMPWTRYAGLPPRRRKEDCGSERREERAKRRREIKAKQGCGEVEAEKREGPTVAKRAPRDCDPRVSASTDKQAAHLHDGRVCESGRSEDREGSSRRMRATVTRTETPLPFIVRARIELAAAHMRGR